MNSQIENGPRVSEPSWREALADQDGGSSAAKHATESLNASVMERTPSRKRAVKHGFLGFSVTTVTVIGCFALGEIGLRAFSPIPDPYAAYKNQKRGTQNQYIRSEFPPNVRVITEVGNDLPGMAGQHVFSTNNMGFRGDYLAIP